MKIERKTRLVQVCMPTTWRRRLITGRRG